jgi:amino acid adenylation domain-containing protein
VTVSAVTGPATFAQERLYLTHELHGDDRAYHIVAALDIGGPLDVLRLRGAAQAVVDHHSSLRATFAADADHVIQIIQPPQRAEGLGLDWRMYDGHPGGDPSAALRRVAADLRSFDLRHGPLIRWGLLRLGPEHHGLVMVAHHIICDGFSVGIIFRDLEAAYSRGAAVFTTDAPDPLASAHREREQWTPAAAAAAMDFWRDYLGDCEPLAVPPDRARQGSASGIGGSVHRPLPPARLAALRRLARGAHVSPFIALSAITAGVLARHTGGRDVLMATPVANRVSASDESLVGCLVNVIPIRIEVPESASVGELLRSARRTIQPALAHQNTPFDAIVREFGLRTGEDGSSWIRCSLTVQNFDASPPRLGGLTVTDVELGVDAPKWHLAFTVDVSGDDPFLRVEYDADLYARDTAEALLAHLDTALDLAVLDPDRPLRIVADDEAAVLGGFNPAEPLAEPSLLPALLEQVLVERPDAVAVVDRDGTLTYGELARRAALMGARLRATERVKPGDKVGICASRRLTSVVAMVGIWRAGAAFVPMDPAGGHDRVARIVATAGVDTVVVDSATRDVVARWLPEVRLVDVHQPTSAVEGPPGSDGPQPLASDSLAYVIFTSGSTGSPKGVEVTHGNLAALLAGATEVVGAGPGDVWSCTHSLAFDYSVWEIFGPLATGGRCVLVDDDQRRDPDTLAEVLAEHGATIVSQTPASLYRLLEAVSGSGSPRARRWRAVVSGGDVLDWQRLAALTAGVRDFGARVVNMYGITEGTVHVTSVGVTPGVLGAVPQWSVGRPLPGARCYVLDPRGEPAGLDVVGELYVAGQHVARGYVNDEEQTRNRFLPDPWSPGRRMYRTGDLARWRSGGWLQYVGRNDDQVKVRGYRVEPAEVERAVLACPDMAVRACAVLATGDHLVAFLESHVPVPDVELRRHLSRDLPHYLVPTRFLQVEAIPLTPNGKIDKAGLVALLEERAAPDLPVVPDVDVLVPAQPVPVVPPPAGAAAPPTPEADLRPPPGDRAAVTRAVVEAWRTALAGADFGLTDNFFDVGGHSFALLQVRELLRAGGLHVRAADLFRYTSVQALVDHLKGEHAGEGEAAARTAPPAGVGSAATRPRGAAPSRHDAAPDGRVAVIGMAARLPRTEEDLDAFWELTAAGQDAVTRYSAPQLAAVGVPAHVTGDDLYRPFRAAIEDVAGFDRVLFGYSPAEAALIDPQHRALLECSWAALEDSGHAPVMPGPNRTGVFVGVGVNAYLWDEVVSNRQAVEAAGPLQTVISVDKDYASTRISYKLNLQGPGLTVQTACSTSLVAVHMAARSLIWGESDLALAGGCSVAPASRRGYVYQPGGIFSSDGRCRPFDQGASGTVPGDGVGVVVLKRLADALRDGDPIRAVILGSAVNNDGARKAGYTAPGPDGQVLPVGCTVSLRKRAYVQVKGAWHEFRDVGCTVPDMNATSSAG